MSTIFNSFEGVIVPSKIEKNELSKDTWEFIFSPLSAGFGTTIGNTLRRILLSSIEGYAINYVAIKGVKHEFDVIDGVVEDMVDIILNLKRLRFKKISEADSEVVNFTFNGYFENGKDILNKTLTGADINACSKNFKVVNDDFVVCHFSKPVTLEIELGIQKGIGWSLAKKFEVGVDREGVIFIDSIFSPVKKVKMEIEDARIGSNVGFDTLKLEITTDCTTTPFNTLEKAIVIAKNIFNSFDDNKKFTTVEKEAILDLDIENVKIQRMLNNSIKDMGFSKRSFNALNQANIKYVKELVVLTEENLLAIKNLGKKSRIEINEFLSKNNLRLKMDLSEYNL